MGKRIMLAIVGAAIGSVVGILASALGGGNAWLIACALAGAILPQFVLGAPGR